MLPGSDAPDGNLLEIATADAMLLDTEDFLDEVFLPPDTKTGQTVNKFAPKLRHKTKKPFTGTSKPSDAAPHPFTSNAKQEIPRTDEGNLEQETDVLLRTESLGNCVRTSSATGVAETIGASNLSSNGSAPMSCSSRVNEISEPSNVTTNLLSHEVACQTGDETSERERSLQTDPNKSEYDAMPHVESLDDILMEPSDISEVKQVSEFQPKSGSRLKGRKAKSVSFSLTDAAKTASPVRPLSEVLTDDFEGAKPPFARTMNEELTNRTSHSMTTVSDDVDFLPGHGSLRNADLTDISGLESFDSILSEPESAGGQTVPKFRPKMSARPKATKPDSFSKTNAVRESTSSLGDSLPLDSEQLEGDDVFETIDINTEPLEGHDFCFPADSSTNIVNEQTNHVEMSSLEIGSPGGDDEFETIDIPTDGYTCYEVPPWNDEEQTQQILDNQITSKSSAVHGADKSSRKSRKRIPVGSTSEKLDCGIGEHRDVENSNGLHMDEDHHDDEHKGKGMPKQKEPKRSKRQMTDAQKPKRRKKAMKESDSTKAELPKKRFPHGTRRKRRQVNKVLLETPDNELDRGRLPFRDLIMLAEAKEKIASKEGANLNDIHSNNAPFFNGSRVDHDNPYDEDLDPDGEEAHRNMLRNSRKLNYQTYMNKQISGRWSKSETALFYEAIRQFGTDFEMIVQLFPNRTRSQVKSKFKTEERKHPSEVRDAMMHRSEDHSHFERVIQQLQTQAEDDSMLDDANDVPAMGSEEAANANQEGGGGSMKDELGDAANSEKRDEWDDDDCASLDLNEYESCDWDAGTSFQNEQKYSEYDDSPNNRVS